MPVCSYYLRGNCKFGDNCRNEHPRGAFGNLTWSNQRNPPGDKMPFPFSIDSITRDLTAHVDKPLWPLSSYGPAKSEPNLLSGLDESPEELRVRAVTALRAGNANEYMAYENRKIDAAEGTYSNARSNAQQAYEVATKQSPVASIINSGNNSIFNKPATSAFGAQTTSAFGAPKSAFGQPAFGQTGFGTTPSPFGQQASASTVAGTFGQPVQPPSNFGTPAFGQPSQPQSGLIKPASGAFSNFATGPGAFGATAGSGSTGGGFGTFAKQTTSFGPAAAGPTGGSAFGQPSFGAASVFAPVMQQQQQPPPPPQTQSAFGGFGQPPTSAFGATTQSAFGAPSMQPQPFGSANITSPQSAFRAVQSPPQPQPHPTAFSAFGQSSTNTTTTTTSAFGQPPQQQPSGISGFGQGSSPFGTSQPPPSTALPEPPSNNTPEFVILGMQQLSSGAGGNSALYKPGSTPYDGMLPPDYVEMMPREAVEAFKSKTFELGKVPECVPPLEMR